MEVKIGKWLILVLVLVLGLVGSASADMKALPDAVLQGFVEFDWNDNILNNISDIAGDPGTCFNITLFGAAWSDVAAGVYGDAGLSPGDQWELAVYNPDAYATFIQAFMQVDGWQYTKDSDAEGWVNPGETAHFVFDVDPGITVIDAVGIKIGTDSWTGRPPDSTFNVNIVPEPTTLLLLGVGGALLRRRRV